MDIWPALPLIIRNRSHLTEGLDNVIALLERAGDRVCQIGLGIPGSQLETVSAVMQEPFPELTSLVLWSYGTVAILPDSFLGRSAPHLRSICLEHIPFPGLLKLLLSASHLVILNLLNIPHSGYISPEVMVTALSALTSLGSFMLEFQSPQSCPDRENRRLHSPTRSVLPVLTFFWFQGVIEYLEDLVAYVDAPQLSGLYITLFNQIIFDTPRLVQFISRTPRLNPLDDAHVAFGDEAAEVHLSSGFGKLNVKISCRELDWQVSSLEQVFTSSLPPLSMLEDLYIFKAPDSYPHWQDNIENMLWLELLHPFTAVKNLYLSEEFAPRIVPALQEHVGGIVTTEVLPTLQNIILEGLQPSGPVQEGIEQFVATRQVTSHTIAVSLWDNSKVDKVLGDRWLINAVRLLSR
jgi:hypothetical protein